MEGAIVLFAIGAVRKAITYSHVCCVVHERLKQTWSSFGRVGIVAVDHDVVIGIDLAEHLAHHITLALARLGAHDSTVVLSDSSSIVFGIVVVDVDIDVYKRQLLKCA